MAKKTTLLQIVHKFATLYGHNEEVVDVEVRTLRVRQFEILYLFSHAALHTRRLLQVKKSNIQCNRGGGTSTNVTTCSIKYRTYDRAEMWLL
jgi:hypothetical protein